PEVSLQYLYRALDQAAGRFPTQQVRIHTSIAMAYSFTKNYKESEQYLRKGIAKADRVDPILLADLYGNMNKNFYLQKQLDSAEVYAYKSLELYQALGNHRLTVYTMNNIGLLYKEQKNWEKALQIYQQTNLLNEASNDAQAKAAVFINLGEVYFRLNELEKAQYHLDNGMKIAQQHHRLHFVENACELKAELLEAIGQSDSALYYLHLRDEIKDTIHSTESAIKALTLKNNRTLQQQEQLLHQQYEQKLWRFVASMAAILLCGFFILFQPNRQTKALTTSEKPLVNSPLPTTKINTREEEKRLLQRLQSDQIDWPAFLIEYENLVPNFFHQYRQLGIKHSSNTLKHCISLRLGLSLKETANFLDVSINTVKSARNRLKKQLHLRAEDSIQEFINSL
ncbi:MAG: tetratricopeptide repeat protein, partial [Bacteroidota bacterium]